MSVAIKFENISKQYRLGEVGTGTLSHDLHRAWAKLRGKPDPFAKVGGINDRTQSSTKNQELGTKNGAASDYVWALRDINFEVQQGEILGIIGRNGAGKSTLLKILSRVTAPTNGRIKSRGRIASLLEVGTGFHPELTGRENIYLNGAILGMRRHEITTRLEEIIEFSGCAKYIDTPVKRYSSGMTVRLGFAVAAHLDCEILIVDEVLAVGDHSFQTKCLSKMDDIAQAGMTILFVSHNMTAVRSLCSRALILRNGEVSCDSSTEEAVRGYLSQDFGGCWERKWINGKEAPQGCGLSLLKTRLNPTDDGRCERLTVDNAFDLIFLLSSDRPRQANLSLHFRTTAGEIVFAVASPLVVLPLGQTFFKCKVPGNLLNDGIFSVELLVVVDGKAEIVVSDALTFEIDDRARTSSWLGKWPGFVRPQLMWEFGYTPESAEV